MSLLITIMAGISCIEERRQIKIATNLGILEIVHEGSARSLLQCFTFCEIHSNCWTFTYANNQCTLSSLWVAGGEPYTAEVAPRMSMYSGKGYANKQCTLSSLMIAGGEPYTAVVVPGMFMYSCKGYANKQCTRSSLWVAGG